MKTDRPIRIPETCRPGFAKLGADAQAAAAKRDVAHLVRSLSDIARYRRALESGRCQTCAMCEHCGRRLDRIENQLELLAGLVGRFDTGRELEHPHA